MLRQPQTIWRCSWLGYSHEFHQSRGLVFVLFGRDLRLIVFKFTFGERTPHLTSPARGEESSDGLCSTIEIVGALLNLISRPLRGWNRTLRRRISDKSLLFTHRFQTALYAGLAGGDAHIGPCAPIAGGIAVGVGD